MVVLFFGIFANFWSFFPLPWKIFWRCPCPSPSIGMFGTA